MKNKPRKKKKWKGGVYWETHKDGIYMGIIYENIRFKNGKIIGYVSSPEHVKMGAVPSVIRLLKVDGWKVIVVFDTNEVREYDFHNKYDYWKRRSPKYDSLFNYEVFASIYYDEIDRSLLFPLVFECYTEYDDLYDYKYLEKHGYKYKDENGYFEFYAIYGEEIYDKSVLIDPDFTHWRKENWWNKKKK